MKNWWIRFGCFLTGHNYRIIRNSSEVSAKNVKRYASALMIVCVLWSFIGFFFTNRYMQAGVAGSLLGALVFVVIIIQIERQIILSVNPNKGLYIFRTLIAALMSVIGALIIDQIIFKDDIDLAKRTSIKDKVEEEIGPKTEELNRQIRNLDTALFEKELERAKLIADISKNPTSRIYSIQSIIKTEKTTETDPITGAPITTEKPAPVSVTNVSNVPNPKIAMMAPLEETIKDLRTQRSEKETYLLNVRPKLEKEISEKAGFIDELEIMYKLISGSGIALMVWLIWFFFLLGLCLSPLNIWTDFSIQFRTLNLGRYEQYKTQLEH